MRVKLSAERRCRLCCRGLQHGLTGPHMTWCFYFDGASKCFYFVNNICAAADKLKG